MTLGAHPLDLAGAGLGTGVAAPEVALAGTPGSTGEGPRTDLGGPVATATGRPNRPGPAAPPAPALVPMPAPAAEPAGAREKEVRGPAP